MVLINKQPKLSCHMASVPFLFDTVIYLFLSMAFKVPVVVTAWVGAWEGSWAAVLVAAWEVIYQISLCNKYLTFRNRKCHIFILC